MRIPSSSRALLALAAVVASLMPVGARATSGVRIEVLSDRADPAADGPPPRSEAGAANAGQRARVRFTSVT